MGYAKIQPEEQVEITSRHIPGHILQVYSIGPNKEKITHKDKLALSLYHYLPKPPKDKVLATLLGGGETEESARQTREKLQQSGVLKFIKSGKTKKAIITLPKPPHGTLPSGLVIDKLLFKLKEFSDRFVVAVELGFTNFSNGWRAWKIGMPLSSYMQAKARVERVIPMCALQIATQANHIPKPKQTIYPNPSKPYPLNKDIIKTDSKDLLSKDNSEEPLALRYLKNSPSKESSFTQEIISPIKKEYNMSIRIPYTTKAPVGFVENHLRLSKLESIKKPKNDFKKNKFIPPKYSIEVITDMNWIRKELPLVHSPGPDTKAYWADARVINALVRGPSNYLRKDEIQKIIHKMIGKTVPGGNYPLTEKVLRDRFLDRSFNQEERRTLYRWLNNMDSVEYRPQGVKIDNRGNPTKVTLAWGMISKSGFSWLARLWMANPVKVIHQMPVDFKSVERELEQAIEIIPKKIIPEDKPKLARNIINLKKRYFQEYKPKMNGNSFGRNTWSEFFGEFLDSIEDSVDIINVGWFNPDNRPVKKFLYEIGVGRPVARVESRQFSQPEL